MHLHDLQAWVMPVLLGNVVWGATSWPGRPSDQQPLQDKHDSRQSPFGLHAGKYDTGTALVYMMATLETMQDTFFNAYAGTWPDASDWTAAVMQTHVAGTLSSLVLGLDEIESPRATTTSSNETSCARELALENIVNKYFAQTTMFYFGENSLALRGEAFDDMLWVVLGWLENLKFAETYSLKRFGGTGTQWHGMQTTSSSAHRARTFYELASRGWNASLCGGGMTWNPRLPPYKNAITNELYAAASIAMYLYFPGDNITAPFSTPGLSEKPHDPKYLQKAIETYKWLGESGMKDDRGLWQDGYHITGWTEYPNGTIDPGTGKCDDLNTMVYTYNQGVILSASRGLWLATGAKSYLDEGHALVNNVMRATGWLNFNGSWQGLGRDGVMEDFCDQSATCGQDGQTFKGIFFHHLSEFCRTLWPQDEEFLRIMSDAVTLDEDAYKDHLVQCSTYGKWIENNAKAAWETRNKDGLIGGYWGVKPDSKRQGGRQTLPPGAVDRRNSPIHDTKGIHVDDSNDRGRGRTVETQSGGLAVLRANWQWDTTYS